MKSKLVIRTLLMFFQHADSCINCQNHGFPTPEAEKNSILLFAFSGKIFSHRNLDCQEQLSGTDQIILSFRGERSKRFDTKCGKVQPGASHQKFMKNTIFSFTFFVFCRKVFFSSKVAEGAIFWILTLSRKNVDPATKKDRDWLLGGFIFGTEIGEYQWKKYIFTLSKKNVDPATKKDRDWLLGGFIFGTEIGEYQWKSPCIFTLPKKNVDHDEWSVRSCWLGGEAPLPMPCPEQSQSKKKRRWSSSPSKILMMKITTYLLNSTIKTFVADIFVILTPRQSVFERVLVNGKNKMMTFWHLFLSPS